MDERLPIDRKLALSAVEAGELVGLSETSIRRMVRSGFLKSLPGTDRLLIARVELDRWMRDGVLGAAS